MVNTRHVETRKTLQDTVLDNDVFYIRELARRQYVVADMLTLISRRDGDGQISALEDKCFARYWEIHRPLQSE